MDLCNLIINSPGVPNNWESNITTIQSIGLRSINSMNLSSNKINNMINSNYLNIIKNLNKNYIYSINIVGLKTNTNYLNFGYSINNSNTKYFSDYNCYSNYNNEIVRITTEVWK